MTEKQRHDLRKVTQRSSWPVFIIKGKVARFEALAPTLNCRQTDNGFSQNSTTFFISRHVSLPLQEVEFHYASMLILIDFD
jgi:hypothetical protein